MGNKNKWQEKINKVDAAVEKYKQRKKTNVQAAVMDITKRLKEEEDAYNAVIKAYDPDKASYGEENFKKIVESQRQRRINISNLKRDLESYRNYLGKDVDVDSVLSNLDKMTSAYDTIASNSQVMSKFKNEDEYNDFKKTNELYNMSTEEILPHLDTSKADAERSTLVSKKDELQKQIRELGNRPKGKGAIKRQTLQKELNKIDKQLAEIDKTSGIAYTTLSGENITWESLYASKKREEELQNLIISASGNANFEEKSKYSTTKSDGWWDKLTAQYSMGYNDLTYEWINNKDGIRNEIENKHRVYGSDGVLADNDSKWKEKAYDFLEEDEIKIYNYYYATEGKEKAEEFLESLQQTLYQRQADERFGKYKDNTGLEILFGIESGLEQFNQGVKNAFNFSDDYIPYTDTQLMAGMVREDLEDDGFKIGNNSIAQIAYDSVQTTANMLPSMAVGFLPGGQALTAISVGLSASGNSYQDALNQGYGKTEARTYATLNGAAEAGLQYVLGGIGKGAGKLTGKTIASLTSNISKANLRIAANLGVRGLGEGLEEYLQAAVIEPVLSNAILGTNKEIDLLSEEALYNGFLGAITSITLGAPGEIAGAIKTRSQGKDVIQKGEVGNLVKFGKSLSADTVAHKLANKVDENTGAYTVGLLLQEAGAESLSATNMADIEKSLVRKGVTEKDAKNISAWLNKAVEGGTFTKSQIDALENNEIISQTFKDVILNQNSTVNQRTRGYDSLLGLANEVAAVPQAPTKEQISANINASIAEKNAFRQAISPTFGTTQLPSEVAENVSRMSAEKSRLASNNTNIETDFNVSEDGKTTDTTTGAKIKLAGIASIKDGEVMLKTEDGETINAKDVSYASEEEGLIYESFVDFNPAFANAVIKNYDGKVPVQTYIKGMREGIVLYGMHNFQGVGKDISKNTFFAKLPETDQAFALKLGSAYAESVAKKQGKALRMAIKNAAEKAEANKDTSTKATAKKGSVSFEGGVAAKGKLQKRTVSLAKHLARAIGIDIVFYDSRTTTNPHGEDNNGYYNPYTDTIHLDLQNSASDAKTIAFTLSHELVHFIKKWSPQKFNTFAKFLMEQYAEHGVNTSTLLSNKMAELGTKDADLAYEEMIADACETMLLDSNAVYKLMELRKTDLELFEKIKLHIHELLNKIRDMYKKLGLQPTSDEAKALLGMTDVLEQIYSLFEEASVDAAQTYQAAQNANETVFGEESVDVGKTESGIKNQLKNHKKIGEDATSYNDRHKNVHKAILQVGIESMYEMAEVMLPYLEEEGILPPDIPGKTIFKNGSYGRTGENTTLCVRTLTYEDFKDRVAENLGRPLTVSESLLVSQKIYDIATEPQCIYCYVAADRKAYDGYLGEYWRAMDKYIKAMRKGGDSKALYTEYLAGRKDTNQQRKRWSQWEAIAKSGKDYISANDLTTKRKRDALIAKKNAFSEQIKDAQRYAQSASWAKTVFDYRAYKGDILKMTSKFVDMLNSEYGLRMYSFSDYTPAFIVENMQMIIDASVKGLKSLAYTKDTDYAEIFASTGQAINVSCFAKWDAESGAFVEDNRQGADWAKTQSLRKQYRNVGAVMVATNDAMVEWALKQDWVDVVIPYHIVKTGTTIANEYQWNNYTSESADRVGNKTANIYPTEHNNDFATYSNLLSERGITPRFSRWYDMVASGKLTESQYMKLVNEVRLPASELSAVVPSFNLEAAKKSFGIDNEGKAIKGGFVDKGGYMGGWYREGVDVNQEVMAVSEDIKAGKSSLDVDYGMSKAAKEKVEEKYKPSVKKQLKKASDKDYLDAVNNGDMETAQRMVDEAAKANGYPQKLYHGTNKFGFTKIDVSNSDDGISFFATDTEETAETYSSGVKRKRISDASESLPDGNVEEIQDEIKSLTNRLSEWCNRNLGIQGWVDYDYFKSKLEDCFYELEIGTPVDSVISDFDGFCDELYFSFADNYYQGNYEDNPYLDEEDYLSWEDWQESKEANDLSDEYWNNVAQIIAKFKALDTSANSGVYDLYANTEGMLVVDAKGENWNRLPDPRDADGKLGLSGEFNFRMFTTRDYARYGKAEGYRGVIFKNMKDSGDGSYVKPTTVYIFFNPQEQVKSADPVTYDDNGNVIPLSERFNEKNPDIRYQKKRNPSSYAPTFYSQMGKVVEGIKQEKIGADSVLNFMKGKVKKDEIKWSGIETFLEGKKSVTKQELLDFINGSMLQIEEEERTESIKYNEDEQKRLNELSQMDEEVYNEIVEIWEDIFKEEVPFDLYESNHIVRRVERKLDSANLIDTEKGKRLIQLAESVLKIGNEMESIRDATKQKTSRWKDYKLDGGTNYRELVFKMPNADYSNKAMRAHWGNDAQGILAHARIQDFNVDGKKMLFIEEIQSDWHNEGQKEGYAPKEVVDLNAELRKIEEERQHLNDQYNTGKISYEEYWDNKHTVEKMYDDAVESLRAAQNKHQVFNNSKKTVVDAPFKDTYHEYVIKRLLRLAAEEGYDSIGWTPADIQSERWSDEYAEGYRIEYDQDMPKFLKKYGKQWGATVGSTTLPFGGETIYTNEAGGHPKSVREWVDDEKPLIRMVYGDDAARNLTVTQEGNKMFLKNKQTNSVYATLKVQENGAEVWSMDITEPMEQAVLYEGQAKFQKKKVSNRTILSNALESAIDTSTQAGQNELKWLKEYQSKIDTIEKEEAHLAEVNAEIKKISFGKDTDRSKLKDLNADKVRTNNRINTYDKQLMRLEAMKPIKDILAREKEMVRKRTEEKGREALANYRREALKVRNQMIGEARRETRQKISESRSRTEMRHKIKKVVSELNQLLLKGNKDKRVMIGLQKAVAEALDAVNMDTVDADNRVAKYNALIAKAKDPDVIASLTETRDRIQAMGDRMSSKLTSLKNAYGEIKNSTDPLIANSYDEVIASSIEHVVEKVGDTPLRAMSIEQLEDVYDLYTMVLTRIRDANKAFKANKGESISTLSNKVMMEVEKVGGSKTHVLGGKLGAALSLVKKFDFNNLKPVYAFERIGSNTLSQIFENVRKGEDVWAVDITEAKDFKENAASKYNYKKWDFDKVYSFKTSTGNQFSLTLEQIMSLYAYSKREQALPHLAEGGFVFDSNIETHKEKGNGKKSVLKYRVNTATAHKISPFEVADIVGKLTSDQKAFVDEMQKYLSDVMGAKGNEVALEMYGVKLFKEKHYFPLKSAKQYMFEQNDVAGEVKIKNSGFSKGTVKHANNPVILSNFMDVWANHVNDMSMYHAFVLPLEDFNRVFNYNTPASQSLDEESVKGFIQNAYGTHANEYISQLIKDLNGGARIDPRESVSKNMIGKFKKASVFGSASVVVQQPSAVGRALAIIGAKYFDFNPKIINHNKLWAEVKKYAPVAIIKEMGHFDTDMGASTVDYIKGEKSLMEKADDIISKPASYMDELTWVHIWTAVKREVKANNKGLSGEAYLQKCGERFTEVVTKTQVYDSVLSRSANMRSKGVFMNMLTSFMAEPTTSINMLEDAMVKFSRGQKGKASRQIASVAASVILNSMLVAFVYAARDDDEDETYWEKYIGSLTSEIIDGSNPITYYPILKDIWSIAQGFDVERSDMTLISKAITSLKNVTTVMLTDTEDMTEEELAEHNQKIVDAWLGVAGEFSSLFGIPAKNLIRDIKAGFNVYNTANNGAEGSWSLLWDAVAESATDTVPIVGWFDTETKADELYDAIISGDTSVVNRLKSGYKDDKAYNNAIRKALRENDPRIKEAAKARFDGDMTRYKDIAYQIKGEGHFTQDNIVAAIMTEYNALKSATSEESSASKSPEMYNYTDYYNAIINGDDNDIAVVKDYLIESGKTENNIESNLNSKVKEAYEEGELSESEAKALMVSYGGKTEDEADIAIRYVDFKAEYPDYKDVITEARFANYYEPMKDYYGRSVADTGLSISAYAEYCEKSAECKGTDANGDGKTDSGSKKAQVLRVINSLPISSAQKDALYYLNGWAKSKLYSEAPWH